MGIPDQLTCLLRNLYVGQEATVKNLQRTTDWLKIGKRVTRGYILSPYFFNLHVEYIMWNAVLDESQPRIKIAGRNINNLEYAVGITLMPESEEELKGLLMRVKESEKAGLKLSISKNLDHGTCTVNSWQIAGEKVEAETDFIFLGSKITGEGDCRHEIKTCFFLWRKDMTNLDSILKSKDIILPQRSV